MKFARLVLLTLFVVAVVIPVGFAQTMVVYPAGETTPVSTSDDAADDSCIWVHPEDGAKSLIIGTNKDAGLNVYTLEGDLLHSVAPGKEPNNVDIRHEVEIGLIEGDVVATAFRSDNTLGIFMVDPETGGLRDMVQSELKTDIDVYGMCLYRDLRDGSVYIIVNSKEGWVQQWKLLPDGPEHITAELVAEFNVGGQVEGCVADDELDVLYIGEEQLGIWRYRFPLEESAYTRRLVDVTGHGGHLVSDVEGLALWKTEDDRGYLIASSQGNDSFVVYRRDGDNDFVGRFTIEARGALGGCEETDGIAVCADALGPRYPNGLFVAQDGLNGSENQNFKLVSWKEIAAAFDPPLAVGGGIESR